MILDASVASHWFVDTEFSQPAAPYRFRDDLIGPGFLLLETANVLHKRSRAGEMPPDVCSRGVVVLQAAVAKLFADAALLPAAIDLALAHLHPVYDCLYLALALQERKSLVTADRKLATLARRLAIETELIEPAL